MSHELEIDPHANQPLLTDGVSLASAKAAMILLHGRGAGAEDILSLSEEFPYSGLAFLAPQAMGDTWYPNTFLAPLERNEPFLTSAVKRIHGLVAQITAHNITHDRIILAGFSQGACLALESAARLGVRLGGILAFSGGLIGPVVDPKLYPPSLNGTPVFLGCDEFDPHIPAERVRESAELLSKLGAKVNIRLYSRLGHSINHDEIKHARSIVEPLINV